MAKRILLFMLGFALLIYGCSSPAQPQAQPQVQNPTAVVSTNILITPTEVSPTSPPPTVVPPTPTELSPTVAPTQTEPPKRVQIITVPAPSLANNMLGEKAERKIMIYLPPSYFTSEARYPVVYYLPGFQESYLQVTLPDDIDKLIQDGKIQEMILVTASGQNDLGGSFYVNSPVTGNWEDFITKDLINYIDANYRTIADANSRAISGFSMGGYGSLNLAMKHPDLFSSVYSMSPGLFDENGLAESQLFSGKDLPSEYLDAAGKMAEMTIEEALRAMGSNNQVFTFAYGEAFSPDPTGKPPYIKYPYTLVDGKLVRDDTVWKEWESGYGGIKDKIAQYKDNFLKLKGIGLNYGTSDEYAWIPKGCVYFTKLMQAAGIPIEVTTYTGGHTGLMSDRVLNGMLPFLSARLGN